MRVSSDDVTHRAKSPRLPLPERRLEACEYSVPTCEPGPAVTRGVMIIDGSLFVSAMYTSAVIKAIVTLVTTGNGHKPNSVYMGVL